MPRKCDFNVIVRKFDGAPYEETVYKTDANGVHVVGENGQLTFERIEARRLKAYLFDLLGGSLANEQLTGAQKIARYAIASKIAGACDGVTEITDEDVSVLLTVLEKGAAPLIYGLTRKVLDDAVHPPAAET